MTDHCCRRVFTTRKIDACSGQGSNTCFGISPMELHIWFEDQDGTECYFDNWIELTVDFCPFCGLKSEGL